MSCSGRLARRAPNRSGRRSFGRAQRCTCMCADHLGLTGRASGVRRTGKYIKAIGTLRVFQGKRNVAANTICLVTDPNQIIFHQLQAISVHSELTKASVRTASRAADVCGCKLIGRCSGWYGRREHWDASFQFNGRKPNQGTQCCRWRGRSNGR